MAENHEERIAALETKVQELDALCNLALRLLALEKPISAVLERYARQKAKILPCTRSWRISPHARNVAACMPPSFAGSCTTWRTGSRRRGDVWNSSSSRLDTLKVDRLAYQKLHTYVTAQGWPQWT